MIVMLEGLIETSYTQADNASVVATDTSRSYNHPLLTISEEHSIRLLQKVSLRP
jgi:urate oxidase